MDVWTRLKPSLDVQWMSCAVWELIEKINANFSSYFFAMDCAGEVTLSLGENVVSVKYMIYSRNTNFSCLITK